jgi:hypothetical protein
LNPSSGGHSCNGRRFDRYSEYLNLGVALKA